MFSNLTFQHCILARNVFFGWRHRRRVLIYYFRRSFQACACDIRIIGHSCSCGKHDCGFQEVQFLSWLRILPLLELAIIFAGHRISKCPDLLGIKIQISWNIFSLFWNLCDWPVLLAPTILPKGYPTPSRPNICVKIRKAPIWGRKFKFRTAQTLKDNRHTIRIPLLFSKTP